MNDSDKKSRVAFYGSHGSFSEDAALKLCGAENEFVPRDTFEKLFSSIDEGRAERILTPIENSIAGSVTRALDLLITSSLIIKAEVITRINLCLIGCPGASLEEIVAVESHPTALAQCENFFAEHPQIKRIVAADDTAGSVARTIQKGDRALAAVAGQRAAEIYGGSILRFYLEDDHGNYTRFLLLAEEESGQPERPDKLSLSLWLPPRADALRRALTSFTARGINLLKIEPRPVKGQPWQYCFYLELETPAEESEVAEALSEIWEYAAGLRLLGCYSKARII